MPEYIFPCATRNVSDDFEAHRNRTPPSVNPGTDYTCGYGSDIWAVKAGTVTVADNDNGGSGGRILEINHGDGSVAQYLHLASLHVGVGQRVEQGAHVAQSGASGFGSDRGYGPHLHLALKINGRNVDFENYVGRSSGGGSSSGITASKRAIQTEMAKMGLYDGAIDGDYGPKSWRGVQTILKNAGLYSGPIDGVPGPKTYAGFQQYGKKNGNYPGAMDGVLGPLSWAGFYQTLIEDNAAAASAAAAAAAKAAADAAAAKAAADAAAAAAAVKPEPTPTPTPVPEKPVVVTPEKPVKPTKPTNPTRPSLPTKPTKPVKETNVPQVKPLPNEAVHAGSDALGILIPKAKDRKVAYAVYGLAALVVSNITVGVVVSGADAPVWLIVASAVIGNLAVPFTTLAIANASTNTTK